MCIYTVYSFIFYTPDNGVFIHVGCLGTSNKSVAVAPDRTAFALAALMLSCLGTATLYVATVLLQLTAVTSR